MFAPTGVVYFLTNIDNEIYGGLLSGSPARLKHYLLIDLQDRICSKFNFITPC